MSNCCKWFFEQNFNYFEVLFPSQLFTSVQKVIGHWSGSEPWVSINPNWGQNTALEQSPVQFWSLWWICRQVRVCTVSARLLVTQIRRTGFDSLGHFTLSQRQHVVRAEFWISANNFDIFNNQHTTTHSEPMPVPIDISYVWNSEWNILASA